MPVTVAPIPIRKSSPRGSAVSRPTFSTAPAQNSASKRRARSCRVASGSDPLQQEVSDSRTTGADASNIGAKRFWWGMVPRHHDRRHHGGTRNPRPTVTASAMTTFFRESMWPAVVFRPEGQRREEFQPRRVGLAPPFSRFGWWAKAHPTQEDTGFSRHKLLDGVARRGASQDSPGKSAAAQAARRRSGYPSTKTSAT